jgi:FkbM family methyltransferase
MAMLTGPSGRVVSVEPGAANLERLRRNIAVNTGTAPVEVVDRPLADRPGEVSFFLNSDDSGGNALWDPARFPGNPLSKARRIEERMEAATLDGELARLGLVAPKVVKIDTEGAEQRVLEGAARLLAGRPAPFVIAELHEFGLAQLGCSQQSLRALMEGAGYSTFLLYKNGALPKLVPPATRIAGKVILNVLFSTPEAVARHWPLETFDPHAGS